MVKNHKKLSLLDIKIRFNDICMRELGLDIDENDHIYDMDSQTIYTIKEKFIKYSEEEIPLLNLDEMDLNLIENPRLMETLFGYWVEARAKSKNLEITSFYQSSVVKSNSGSFVVTWSAPDNKIRELKSDIFVNESVRVFNLICKLNHTTHLYDLEPLDIEIVKDPKKS